MATARPDRVKGSVRWVEPVAIIAIVFVAALPHLSQLGFYSDDWALLAGFERLALPHDLLHPEQSILRDFAPRPVHGAWSYLLRLCFGLDPLPYHLVNLAMLAATLVLAVRLLRLSPILRSHALAIVAVYALLPQLSTIKVWFAAYGVTVSQFFLVLGMTATMRWVRSGAWRWKLAALACWGCSILSYEIFIPFIAAAAVAAAWARRPRVGRFSPQALAPELLDLCVIVAGLAYKSLVSARAAPVSPRYVLQTFISRSYDPLTDFDLNAKQALIVNFWATAEKPVETASMIPASSDALTRLVSALVVAAIVACAGRRTATGTPRKALMLIGLGVATFCLGMGIFALTMQTSMTPAGIGNRTAVAAAWGVAVVLVGLAALAVQPAPLRTRPSFMGAVLAICCFGFALRSSQVDAYWADAYRLERGLGDRIARDLRRLPDGGTVLIDGVCPYVGPAIVIETDWDAKGMVELRLGRRLTADVVKPEMRVGTDGLRTGLYGAERLYPYADDLYLYDARGRTITPLSGQAAALQAIGATVSARRLADCPAGYPGHGVPI